MTIALRDRELFREVIGHFMTGVTVITTSDADNDYGLTASAVSSPSLDPPMLLVCVAASSSTRAAISRTRAFCVNVLAEHQGQLALAFATPSSDKFARAPTHRGTLDVPVLTEALASLQCRVETESVGGTHHVLMARVAHAEARNGTPLAYFRGRFGRVELSVNTDTCAAIRAMVLSSTLPLDHHPLEIAPLSERIAAPQSQTFQALLALQAEGMVTRTGNGEFIVAAIDERTADQAFDAREAIELAAAELTIGRTNAKQLAELDRRVDNTNAVARHGSFADLEAYVEANAELHEYLVSMAGNAPLLDAYRRLRIPALMTRLFTRRDQAHPRLADEHLEIADAYKDDDLGRARKAILAHSDHAKAVNHSALAANGGLV